MTQIRDGAIFVADAHYPHHGDGFMDILQKLENGKMVATQLFLMGDIFDLLFGHNDYISSFSHEAVALLNKLSNTIEMHYFEGNHDFCLREVFPNMKVYTREEQPVYMRMGSKRVGLSHGDKFDAGFGYNLYSWWLRNKLTLSMLKPFQRWIIDYRMDRLSQKNICHKFVNFEAKADRISKEYRDVDLIIEGHFHQAKEFGKYISLPSLACQGQIGVIIDANMSYITI